MRIVLQDFYETYFGVFDHFHSKNRPLASVALHDAEENSYGTAIYEKVRSYVKFKIWEHCKLSFTEYMSLPREYSNLMIELASEQAKKGTQTTNEAINALNDINKTK